MSDQFKYNPFTGSLDNTGDNTTPIAGGQNTAEGIVGTGTIGDPIRPDLTGLPEVSNPDIATTYVAIRTTTGNTKIKLQDLFVLIPNGLDYKGDIANADTNPGFPLSPSIADAWLITTTPVPPATGSVGGIDVQIGDWLVYSTSGWVTIQGNLSLATISDMVTGTDDTKYVTPYKANPSNLTAQAGPILGTEEITTGSPTNATVGKRTIQEVIDSALVIASTVGKLLYVDKTRTDTYTETGSSVFPFKTFQGAIDYASSVGDGGSVPYSFVLATGTYAEEVDLNNKTLAFVSIIALGRVAINPVSGNALTSNASNGMLQDLIVRNIEFGKPVVLLGDGTANQFKTTEFRGCSFSGTATVNLNRLNNFAYYDVYQETAFTATNVNFMFFNGGQVQGTFTYTLDSALPQPANGVIGGINILSMMMNGVALTVGGTAVMNFVPHSSRIGTTAGSFTIPLGCNVTAYNSLLRGNWTNNGVLTLRNSHSENAIAGTAPVFTANRGEQISYVPTTPANWSPAPNDVSEALDQLSSNASVGVVMSPTAARVTTNGDDSTAMVGRFDRPFLTIQAALAAVPALIGQVYVEDGQFLENVSGATFANICLRNVDWRGNITGVTRAVITGMEGMYFENIVFPFGNRFQGKIEGANGSSAVINNIPLFDGYFDGLQTVIFRNVRQVTSNNSRVTGATHLVRNTVSNPIGFGVLEFQNVDKIVVQKYIDPASVVGTAFCNILFSKVSSAVCESLGDLTDIDMNYMFENCPNMIVSTGDAFGGTITSGTHTIKLRNSNLKLNAGKFLNCSGTATSVTVEIYNSIIVALAGTQHITWAGDPANQVTLRTVNAGSNLPWNLTGVVNEVVVGTLVDNDITL